MVVEMERRRRAIGLSMEAVSELAGTADRSYAKLITPESESGRLARWETLQLVLDVLFCDGFELRLVPSKERRDLAPGTRRKIIDEAVDFDRKTLRERMSEVGVLGGQARSQRLSPERRSEVARMGARARWARVREAQKVSEGRSDTSGQSPGL